MCRVFVIKLTICIVRLQSVSLFVVIHNLESWHASVSVVWSQSVVVQLWARPVGIQVDPHSTGGFKMLLLLHYEQAHYITGATILSSRSTIQCGATHVFGGWNRVQSIGDWTFPLTKIWFHMLVLYLIGWTLLVSTIHDSTISSFWWPNSVFWWLN